MKNIITDYGAVPGTDCTAAFQAAARDGGHIFVPSGNYILSGQTDACVVVQTSCRFIGENSPNTQISYTAPYGVDCFTLRPLSGSWCDGAGFENMQITPAKGGRYAIRVDLTASGALLRNPSFKHLLLSNGYGADAALKLDNPNNINGFFSAVIGPSCEIIGGIKLVGCGDSVSLLDLTLSGPNIGFYATFQPGAAKFKVGRCNITNDGGAGVLYGADQASIDSNTCEQANPYIGDYNAQIVLSGCRACEIVANNVNNHGNTAGYVLENGTNTTVVSRNVLTTKGGQYHGLIGANSPTNAIGQGPVSQLISSNRCYVEQPDGTETGSYMIVAVDPSSPLWNIPA